jgi:hypothetical protein
MLNNKDISLLKATLSLFAYVKRYIVLKKLKGKIVVFKFIKIISLNLNLFLK